MVSGLATTLASMPVDIAKTRLVQLFQWNDLRYIMTRSTKVCFGEVIFWWAYLCMVKSVPGHTVPITGRALTTRSICTPPQGVSEHILHHLICQYLCVLLAIHLTGSTRVKVSCLNIQLSFFVGVYSCNKFCQCGLFFEGISVYKLEAHKRILYVCSNPQTATDTTQNPLSLDDSHKSL